MAQSHKIVASALVSKGSSICINNKFVKVDEGQS